MKLVTAQQMREADRAAITEFGILSLTLMERAGVGLADFISKHHKPDRGTISILAGRGNNAGDGFVAARLLIERGYEVAVFLTSQIADLLPDAMANWERLAAMSPTFRLVNSFAELKSHYPLLARSTCIVDALLGTGLSSEVKGLYRDVIEFVNALKIPVIACDIPSGLSSDTGLPQGVAIEADWTVTFGLPKAGLFIGMGHQYAGEVEIIDIGIPQEIIKKIDTKLQLIDASLFRDHFKKRPAVSNKGDFGHVLIISGAAEKLGAGYLTSLAALRSGCGLVTYALPDKSFTKFDARYPEIMPVSLKDKGRGHLHSDSLLDAIGLLEGKSVVAIGPAIGTHEDTKAFVSDFVRRAAVPLVIDADALNVLAGNLSSLDHRILPAILTPHPGEMARLAGTDAVKKEEERLPYALKLAASHKVIVVLKGNRTIVATPDGHAFINITGNPAMATAGMGDALTGIIASFVAQGMKPHLAAVAGVYVHGLAGDLAAKHFGDRGVVASDVIKSIPEAIKISTAYGVVRTA